MIGTRAAFALALIVLTVASCGNDDPLSSAERDALERARAKWAANGSLNYTVESRISCFCPPNLTHWTRLTVLQGVIVAAVPVDPLPDGFESSIEGWSTVEALFDLIASPASIVTDVDVAFDPTLGYPRSVDITCGPQVADCGSVREMRNLRIP